MGLIYKITGLTPLCSDLGYSDRVSPITYGIIVKNRINRKVLYFTGMSPTCTSILYWRAHIVFYWTEYRLDYSIHICRSTRAMLYYNHYTSTSNLPY